MVDMYDCMYIVCCMFTNRRFGSSVLEPRLCVDAFYVDGIHGILGNSLSFMLTVVD